MTPFSRKSNSNSSTNTGRCTRNDRHFASQDALSCGKCCSSTSELLRRRSGKPAPGVPVPSIRLEKNMINLRPLNNRSVGPGLSIVQDHDTLKEINTWHTASKDVDCEAPVTAFCGSS